jgi:hypothetical protein
MSLGIGTLVGEFLDKFKFFVMNFNAQSLVECFYAINGFFYRILRECT